MIIYTARFCIYSFGSFSQTPANFTSAKQKTEKQRDTIQPEELVQFLGIQLTVAVYWFIEVLHLVFVFVQKTASSLVIKDQNYFNNKRNLHSVQERFPVSRSTVFFFPAVSKCCGTLNTASRSCDISCKKQPKTFMEKDSCNFPPPFPPTNYIAFYIYFELNF